MINGFLSSLSHACGDEVCGVKWFGKLMWASEGGQLHVISYGGVSNFVHDLQASRSSEI